MKSYFQFLTTPTSDTPGTSLLLHFDNKRYIFGNLSEGTQRASIEQGARILKTSEVFITGRTEWTNVGGLLGFILILADGASNSAAAFADGLYEKVFGKAKKKGLSEGELDKLKDEYASKLRQKPFMTLFGPGNLNYMLATARRFIFRTSMPLIAKEIPDIIAAQSEREYGPAAFAYSDDNIKVWALSVAPAQASNGMPITTDSVVKGERKRSHDEMHGIQSTSDTATPSADSGDDIAKRVVTDMFSSDWKIDRLVETTLGEVKLPAKIFTRNPSTKQIQPYTGPLPGASGCNLSTKVLVRSPWPAVALTERLQPPIPNRESVSYIVRTHPQRGKFHPKQALELGLTDKRQWGRITAGETLTNDKGETITPDMVLGTPKEATGFVVADIPSAEYVQGFLDQYASVSDEVTKGISAFVWILGPGVVSHPALQDFLESNGKLQHLIASTDVCADRLSFDSAASVVLRLAEMDPARYKVPRSNETSQSLSRSYKSVAIADRGQTFQLEPTTTFSESSVTAPLDRAEVLEKFTDEARRAAETARDEIESKRTSLDAWASKLPQPDAEVITLGTGSALPSKYRNVSATLVRIPGWGSVLFDAGEGTVGQLKRMYEADEFIEVMRDLRTIWISHLHADHHLGTASVIKAWYAAVHDSQPGKAIDSSGTSFNPIMHIHESRRLTVMSDTAMLHWLFEYSQLEDFGFSRVTPVCVTPSNPRTESNSTLNWFVPPPTPAERTAGDVTAERMRRVRTTVTPFSLGFSDVQAARVSHCNGAMAVSLSLPSGFKVSYSGDCRPSSYFAKIGADSTLLVHEATFDDELRGDAVHKRHSTTSEALRVASSMRAKSVVLTHFSQRYAKVPVIEYTNDGTAVDEQPLPNDEEGEGEGEGDGDDRVADESMAADQGNDLKEDVTSEGGVATFRLKPDSEMKVCMAFDYMRVKVGEIAHMEKFVPALLALYGEDEVQKGALKGKKQAEQRREKEERRASKEGRSKSSEGGKGKQGNKEAGKAEAREDEQRPAHELRNGSGSSDAVSPATTLISGPKAAQSSTKEAAGPTVAKENRIHNAFAQRSELEGGQQQVTGESPSKPAAQKSDDMDTT